MNQGFEEFQIEGGKWASYKARFQFFLKTHKVTEDDDKVAQFFTYCGGATYDLVTSLLAPKDPAGNEITFNDFMKVLDDHFNPTPNEVVEAYKFNKRDQIEGELINQYVAELRRLASTCNYGQSLDRMLRDRFISGIKDVDIRRRLLGQRIFVNFQAYVDEALQMEATREGAAILGENLEKASINKIQTKPGKPSYQNMARHEQPSENLRKYYKPCYRCHGSHHPKSCEFIDAVCEFCHKKGHIEAACITKSFRKGNQQDQRAEEKKGSQ